MADDRDELARARVGMLLNDKWTLERLVGVGGMASVYAALHRNGARAAVKVLHPDIGRVPEVLKRFLREGKAANLVDHPGAVKVLDDDVIASGPDAGAAFLVMELLEGESLEDRIENGPPISEAELLGILRQILDVLVVAHAAGVVHRDLKPENLFLAQNKDAPDAPPRIKILDFGLARVAEGSMGTMHGLAIGTPSYMAPEQAAGKVAEIDHRTDLFAVGAACFRILSGRTVHPASNAVEIVLKMAKEPAPKLRSVAPQVSEATARIIDKALEFRREDRWPDAQTMKDAVDRALEGEELPQDLLQSLHEANTVVAPVPAEPALPPAPPPPPIIDKSTRTDDSILVSLGLKPSPLRRRWRVVLATALLYGAIALKLWSEPGARGSTELDAGAPDASPAPFDASVVDAAVSVPDAARHAVPKPAPTPTPAPTPSAHPSTKPSSTAKPPHHK